jgi:hypothetical protein
VNIEEILEMLHDQAIDGEFSNGSFAIKKLGKLTKIEKEFLLACYWIGFNNSFEEEE